MNGGSDVDCLTWVPVSGRVVRPQRVHVYGGIAGWYDNHSPGMSTVCGVITGLRRPVDPSGYKLCPYCLDGLGLRDSVPPGRVAVP